MIKKEQLVPGVILWWETNRKFGEKAVQKLNFPIKIKTVDLNEDKFTAISLKDLNTIEDEIEKCLKELNTTTLEKIQDYYEKRKKELTQWITRTQSELDAAKFCLQFYTFILVLGFNIEQKSEKKNN